jgi:hypothetical protein
VKVIYAMGIEQAITFANNALPSWGALKTFLDHQGFPIQLRMIDGDLAFPDEVPPDTWRELRVGTPQGMVTMRHDRDRIVFITFGNADAALVQAWNGLAWAVAEVGGGRIDGPHGVVTAADFRRTAELPAVLRSEP